MVLLGHLHCGEFACGTWGVNPWGDAFSPGGSSAGSGVALSARTVPATIGSDGRGSIRIPAAFQNLTALKPSFGLVSVAGCIPITFTFDVAGPMARSAADCALLLEALAGRDRRDRATIGQPEGLSYVVAPMKGAKPLRGTRIGCPRFAAGYLTEEIAAVWTRAQDELASLGASIVPFERPENPLEENGGKGAGWKTLLGAEALAIHAQFAERRHLHRDEFRQTFNPIAAEVGSAVEYVQAQIKRADLVATWRSIFAEHRLDAVLEPGTATPVLRTDHTDNRAARRVTQEEPWLYGTWSDANFPVVSLPAGLTADDAWPVGLQLVGLPFSDQALLQIAVDYQAATDYHSAMPSGLDDATRAPFVPPPTPSTGPQPPWMPIRSPIEAVLPGEY
jgi:aspartyl-tRNA(Asn)/glutamyl-tRNA(Gln) amidotransferase subunit A